ncbi:MAG: NTP transferase domain-containing protein [Acetobacteraceae bacterium]|nr:NTP transferase domain-containing protein [Acetobacteraceae bacterium]
MIFSVFPLAEAEGVVLAHSHRTPGRVLKKGLVLDSESIKALAESGALTVIGARFEPGDIAENSAAERLAQALAVTGLSRGKAGTGRVNVHADSTGLFIADSARLDAINAISEQLTVATLPDQTPVAAGSMVATIKIIPFAVHETELADVEALIAGAGVPFALNPFRRLTVGLVLSELPGLKASVIEGTIAATEARVVSLGGRMLPALTCAHAVTPIADALLALRRDGAQILLVAGASATVDRRDVGPAAIVRAGGHITQFGMPVDPGNLICLGELDGIPALVLPGCARSPKPNGIDFVLRRIFAGLDVGPAAIRRMGVGGLLKDTEAGPLPRARAAGKPEPVLGRAGVAALVLAAGQSTRMAPYHKLLVVDRGGKTMIARTVDNVLASGARPVLVVVGHRADDIKAALGGRPVTYVAAADYAAGLSASLKAGIAAVPPEATGAVVCLGDMPLVTGRMLDRLIAGFNPDEGRAIVVPVHQGKIGNPILWDRQFFPDILVLSGDNGARKLIDTHAELVAEIDLGDDAILRDFDTMESLATLPPKLRPVTEVAT